MSAQENEFHSVERAFALLGDKLYTSTPYPVAYNFVDCGHLLTLKAQILLNSAEVIVEGYTDDESKRSAWRIARIHLSESSADMVLAAYKGTTEAFAKDDEMMSRIGYEGGWMSYSRAVVKSRDQLVRACIRRCENSPTKEYRASPVNAYKGEILCYDESYSLSERRFLLICECTSFTDIAQFTIEYERLVVSRMTELGMGVSAVEADSLRNPYLRDAIVKAEPIVNLNGV